MVNLRNKNEIKSWRFFFKFLKILYKIWSTFKFLKFVMHEWKSVGKLFYDNIFEKKLLLNEYRYTK